MQALEKAAFAISQHNVADAKETTEHHVHPEDPGEQVVDIADGRASDRLTVRAGDGSQQQLLHNVALRRVGVDPVAGCAVQIEQQVDLLMCHFLDACRLIADGHKLRIPLAQERMRAFVDDLRDHADLEQGTFLAAEHEAHADHEGDGQDQSEDQRRPVANELQVPGMPDGGKSLHHVRSSLPVSSRNKSSRFAGRIRKLESGTCASISVRSVASRSSVVISIRSAISMIRSGRLRALGGKSCRGSSSITSAKCSCSSRRGGPCAMMRPRSTMAISSHSSSASSM